MCMTSLVFSIGIGFADRNVVVKKPGKCVGFRNIKIKHKL